MIYFLTDEGKKKMPVEWLPIYEVLHSGAKTVSDVKIELENFVHHGFSVCNEIERGMGSVEEIERWLKRLVKRGLINEVQQVQ